MTLSPALIWNTAAIALGVIGSVLFLWAMFKDRPRDRLRCPKCWYDMKDVVEAPANVDAASPASTLRDPPWTCPECGKAIRAAKDLKRTRRRKWIATIATLAVCLSLYAPLARDRVIARGWIGAIPTTALALLASVDRDSWDMYSDEGFDGTTYTVISGAPPGSPPFLRELVIRLEEYDAWLVHWRILFHRVIAAVPEARGTLCDTRDAWPRDEQVHMRGQVLRVVGNRDDDLRIRAYRRGARAHRVEGDKWDRGRFEGALGVADGTVRVEIEIQLATRQRWHSEEGQRWPIGPDPTSYRTIWRGIARTIEVDERPVSEIMRPVEDPSDGKEIAQDLYPALIVRMDGTVNLGVGHIDFHVGGPNDCALGLRFEILRDGEVVATGEHFYFNYPPTKGRGFVSYGNMWEECPLRWTGTPPTSLVDLKAAKWTLRAIGDPVVSLRDFNRDRYWPGVITMPLTRFEQSEDEDWDDEFDDE